MIPPDGDSVVEIGDRLGEATFGHIGDNTRVGRAFHHHPAAVKSLHRDDRSSADTIRPRAYCNCGQRRNLPPGP